MICQFKRLIYPRSLSAGEDGYRIALYQPCEKILDSAGKPVSEVKAVGYCLPTSDSLRYNLKGRWSRNTKHGVQFEVESFEEIISPTRQGILTYLASGQIKGIGPKTAEKIYDAFGQDTLNILDEHPEKLLSIPGISENKLKRICESYLASRGARNVVAFLAPYGITPNRAVKLYQQYGDQTMDIVRHHPYRLCEMVGIGFRTADKIAMSMGFDSLATERVDEGLLYTLTEAETRGHLCMDRRVFLRQCLKLLDTEGLTEDMAAARATWLLHDGRIIIYQGRVYRLAAASGRKKGRESHSAAASVAGERAVAVSDFRFRSAGASLFPFPERRAAGSSDCVPFQSHYDYHRGSGNRENADSENDSGAVPQKKSMRKNRLLCPDRTGGEADGRIHRDARLHNP